MSDRDSESNDPRIPKSRWKRIRRVFDIERASGLLIWLAVLFAVAMAYLELRPYLHPRHFPHYAFRTKSGCYVYQDFRNQWWRYCPKPGGWVSAGGSGATRPPPGIWTTPIGSTRFVQGGAWSKCSQPEPDEIEGKLLVSIQETPRGPESDTDGGRDIDSRGTPDEPGTDDDMGN
jgi:hypothetical protein